MTDLFLVQLLLAISRTYGWVQPLDKFLAKKMEEDYIKVNAALSYLIDQGHVVEAPDHLLLTIGGKKWMNDHRHLVEDPKFRYVAFREGSTHLIYSCRDGEENALIERKMGQGRTEDNPEGSHKPWMLLEVSSDTYPTGGAAKRAGKEKHQCGRP